MKCELIPSEADQEEFGVSWTGVLYGMYFLPGYSSLHYSWSYFMVIEIQLVHCLQDIGWSRLCENGRTCYHTANPVFLFQLLQTSSI